MLKKIKLGIIGLSDGNGHPYSWAAIFNGYKPELMRDCGFPVIGEYLARQTFPKDAISSAEVTHVWAQDSSIAQHIAKTSNIPNVVERYEDMIGNVDAVLLARDDSEKHYEMALPFLKAGLPIYIDKPLSTSLANANQILDSQLFDWQVFSCSALRYAKEFQTDNLNFDQLGEVKFITASIPKSWDKYAVHIIEPVLGLLNSDDEILEVSNSGKNGLNIVTVHWKSGLTTVFNVLGDVAAPLQIRVIGKMGFQDLVFQDTYYAFKKSLEAFIEGIQKKKVIIDRTETLKIINIIEKGKI